MKINHNVALFFHWQSLLLLPIFYFLAFAILSAFNYSLTEKDLVPHTGKIILLNTVDATSKKMELKYGKGHSVILKINNEPNLIFIISTQAGSPYERLILSKIKPMDAVTVFTNPIILKSTRLYVEKLMKSKQEVIPYLGDNQKKTSFNLLITSFLFFVGLSVVYFLLLKRRYLRLKQ